MKTIGNQPAFPCDPSLPAIVPEGMTYRQWLIGMAMQGLLAARRFEGSGLNAEYAIQSADAVIQQLDQEKQ